MSQTDRSIKLLTSSVCVQAVGVAEGKGHSQLKMTILPGAQREKFANLRPYDLGEHNKKASEKCPFGHEDMHEVNYATYLPPVLLIPIDHSDGNHTCECRTFRYFLLLNHVKNKVYLRKHDIDGRMFTRGASGTEFEEARQPRHAYSLLAFITYSSGGIGHCKTPLGSVTSRRSSTNSNLGARHDNSSI